MFLVMKGTKIVKQFKRKSNAEQYMKDNHIVVYETCDKKTMPSLVLTWCIKEV